MTLLNSLPFPLGLLLAGAVFGSVASGQGSPVDFGDAPDDASACEGGTLLTPALYPTLFGTLNAFLGRTAPFHYPLADPNEDYFFSAAPTYEDVPFQPTCDWLTPPCDYDGGPLVLCLDPGCTTGIFVLPVGPCHDMAVGSFGFTPTPVGFWIYEVNRGAFSTQPGFVNVAVDWGLDGTYGSLPGEWVTQDEVVDVLPWQTQVFVTGPFPVPTLFPCGNALGWCVDPFWSRFHLSDEEMGTTFDGVTTIWDGSGRLGGYAGGVTVDIVPTTDPQQNLELPRQYCGRAVGSVTISLDVLDRNCLAGANVPLASSGVTTFRGFGPGPQTGQALLTEMLSLSLTGFQPGLGQVVVSERSDKMSLGKVSNVVTSGGRLVSGESFFDIFYVIDLPNLGLRLDTGKQPMRLDAGPIHALPPLASTYRPPAGSSALPLFHQGTNVQAGWLCYGDLTYYEREMCPLNKVKRR